jgi:hypothetical protein
LSSCTTVGFSRRTQLHGVSLLGVEFVHFPLFSWAKLILRKYLATVVNFFHPLRSYFIAVTAALLRKLIVLVTTKQQHNCYGNVRERLFSSVAGLLARCQCASGRSCDWPFRHRVFCSISAFKQMLRWFRFPSGYHILLMQPS